MLDKEKVGCAIARQRKAKGLTQKQLADLLNISYQAVSRWEHGLSMPSLDMIYDIARILETTVDFLLNGLPEERQIISYMDGGLDVHRMRMIKNRIGDLVSKDERLIHTMYGDPVFCKMDTSGMEEPVYVFANHVPGSKERFAMENGYDREICLDLIASAVNNVMRFGVKPLILQANMVCGNNDGGQILLMAEIFKEFCENHGMIFAGFEVAGQAVNYQPSEYKIGALVIGVVDKKKIITGSEITEGDILIGLHTEGISSISYPFIKVMLDRRPDLMGAKINEQTVFVDEMIKPNAIYMKAMCELNDEGLIHGAFGINRSLFNRRNYASMPKGLGAGIEIAQVSIPPLFRYIYELNMMDRECFLDDFSMGVGMVLAVPKERCDEALRIIEKYHKCSVIGRIKKDDEYPDAMVWMEGTVKW